MHTRTHAHTHFCLCFYILCSRSVVPALFCHLLCCCCLNSCPIISGSLALFLSLLLTRCFSLILVCIFLIHQNSFHICWVSVLYLLSSNLQHIFSQLRYQLMKLLPILQRKSNHLKRTYIRPSTPSHDDHVLYHLCYYMHVCIAG